MKFQTLLFYYKVLKQGKGGDRCRPKAVLTNIQVYIPQILEETLLNYLVLLSVCLCYSPSKTIHYSPIHQITVHQITIYQFTNFQQRNLSIQILELNYLVLLFVCLCSPSKQFTIHQFTRLQFTRSQFTNSLIFFKTIQILEETQLNYLVFLFACLVCYSPSKIIRPIQFDKCLWIGFTRIIQTWNFCRRI